MPESGCKVFMDQRNWLDILNENEKNTFRINEGELVRTFISEEKDEIRVFIMAHHILGDGYSLVLLAQDILSNLAGDLAGKITSIFMSSFGKTDKPLLR